MGAKREKKSFIPSTLITILIVAMLVMSGPAQAVTVSISGLSGSITQGTSKTFTITTTMENADTFVPISNISLNVNGPTTKNWTFNPFNGSIISGDSDISVSVTSAPSASQFGYGYGYGVDTVSGGFGYNFGSGYGYGYNFGQGGGNVSFTYQITLSTNNLAVGSYTATAYLNTGNQAKPNFASTSASFTIASAGGGGPTLLLPQHPLPLQHQLRHPHQLLPQHPPQLQY